MTWRTDFDQMPKDGTYFLAWVKRDDWVGAQMVYREHRISYDHDGNEFDDWFWYTDARSISDGECGGIGDSRIMDEDILAWMAIEAPAGVREEETKPGGEAKERGSGKLWIGTISDDTFWDGFTVCVTHETSRLPMMGQRVRVELIEERPAAIAGKPKDSQEPQS